jgi:hypothetical protein
VLSDKNRIFLSSFFSKDKIVESPNSKDIGFDIEWSNATVNLTWTNISSSAMFHNTSLLYTNYSFSTLIKDKLPIGQPYDFYTDSEIHDIALKRSTHVFVSEDHVIKAGLEMIYHQFITTTSDFFYLNFNTILFMEKRWGHWKQPFTFRMNGKYHRTY